MRKVFDKHKIPTSIRGYIYSFLSMRDEFNQVLHQIDTGVHMKLLFIGVVDTGYTDIYGFPKKVKQITSAIDAYKPRYSCFSPDPSKDKFKNYIHLSEEYSYTPSAWPSYKSRQDPEIRCHMCGYRKRYKDKNRAHLTDCTCVYNSIEWLSSKPIYH